MNTSLADYHMPKATSMPKLETIFVSTYEPTGPFGAKSISEVAINGVAPAIANALFFALGIRFRELPLSPERVLRVLSEKAEARSAT